MKPFKTPPEGPGRVARLGRALEQGSPRLSTRLDGLFWDALLSGASALFFRVGDLPGPAIVVRRGVEDVFNAALS